jgi:HAD superfamily phosphoserine phosphatase-like hydrolase
MPENTSSITKETKLHVFDLDGTLLKSNCSFAFSFYLYKKGLLSLFDEIYCLFVAFSYKYLGLSLEKLHKNVFKRLFLKKPSQVFEDEARLFIKEFIPKAINQSVLKKVEEAKLHGDKILILSSSPKFLVQPISHFFKIPYICTEYSINNFGNLEDISLLVSGNKKAEIVSNIIRNENILKKNITAYTDHIDDLPLLKTVGNVIVVKPCCKLKTVAQLQKWEIMD